MSDINEILQLMREQLKETKLIRESLEGIANELALHNQWQREQAQWPRSVTVQERVKR